MTMIEAMRILGVNSGDTLEQIRVKYREQVRKYHPDVCTLKDAKEKMQEVNLAYDFIKKHYNEIKNFNNNSNNNQTLDARTICEKYAKFYRINIKYEEFLNMYLELSKDTLVDFLEGDFAVMVFYADKLKARRNIYQLYRSIRKMDKMINSKQFIEALKKLYTAQKELCNKLGRDQEELYKEFLNDNIKKTGILFLDWLRDEIIIQNVCQLLNTTKEKLYSQYLNLINQTSLNISFFEWLKYKVKFSQEEITSGYKAHPNKVKEYERRSREAKECNNMYNDKYEYNEEKYNNKYENYNKYYDYNIYDKRRR